MRSAIAAGEIDLMQADDGGDAVASADAVQQRQHAVGGRRIEAGDRLVGQDQRRLLRHRARDADALLLAARQLVGAPQRAVEQADALERFQRQSSCRREPAAAACAALE